MNHLTRITAAWCPSCRSPNVEPTPDETALICRAEGCGDTFTPSTTGKKPTTTLS
jgi:hypothetical protein